MHVESRNSSEAKANKSNIGKLRGTLLYQSNGPHAPRITGKENHPTAPRVPPALGLKFANFSFAAAALRLVLEEIQNGLDAHRAQPMRRVADVNWILDRAHLLPKLRLVREL